MSKKKSKGFKPVSWVFVIIQAALSAFLIYLLISFDLLPDKYLNLAVAALAALLFLSAFFACFRKTALLSFFLALLFCAGIGLGCVYLNQTMKTIKNIASGEGNTKNFSVLIKPVAGLGGDYSLNGRKIAVVEAMLPEYLEKAEEELEKDYSSLSFVNYTSYSEAYNAFTAGDTDALLLFEGFRSLLEETYPAMSLETSVIKTLKIPEIVPPEESKNDSENESENESSEEPYVAGEITTHPFCILCMGSDSLSGPLSEYSNHDVNILMVVNPVSKVILMISTPRDFYVEVPYSTMRDKLTHAGCYGAGCSMQTLSTLYGVSINKYIIAGFGGFISIVDILGGIDVYSEVAFEAFGSGDEYGLYQYQAGINHLNGAKALAFCRERHNFDALGGDRQRGKNQMATIKAILQKALSPAILTNYLPLLDAVSSNLLYNFTSEEIAALVKMQLHDMASWSMYSFSVDGYGAFDYTAFYPNEELYVMVPDMNTVNTAKTYIQEVLNGEIPSIPQ